MRSLHTLGLISVYLAVVGGPAWAANSGLPNCPAPSQLPYPQPAAPMPQAPTTPQQPGQQPSTQQQGQQPGQQQQGQQQQADQTAANDAAAQTPEAGTEAAASAAPNMIGDLLGYSAACRIFVTQSSSSTSTAGGTSTSHLVSRIARIPLAGRGPFKIADNESPACQDRIFGTYSYYNDVNRSIDPALVPSFDVHQETVGFEKTFLDGNASFGMRVPFYQLAGGLSQSDIGALDFIFKYALINDCQCGNVLSAGLVVTVPTGPAYVTPDGVTIRDTLIQPFVGYIYNMEGLYFHGFTSLAVPTDSRDVTLLFLDDAIGFWLYQDKHCDALLSGIVPTVEGHVNIPLNNEGAFHDPIGFSTQVDVTVGAHLVFQKADLALGVAIPLAGPLPYSIEALAQFNLRF